MAVRNAYPWRVRYAILLSLLLLGPASVLPQVQQEDPPPVYKGRQVAAVMSYRGAGWLEREGRADEEDTAALLAKLDLQPGQTVADLGCGSGYYSRRMATAVGPEGTVFAVDIQPEMLRILRELAAREGISNIVPVQSQEDDPYLPEGEIDWILLVDVYHELQQPEPMLAAMREALAPGGRIALVEYRLEAAMPREAYNGRTGGVRARRAVGGPADPAPLHLPGGGVSPAHGNRRTR